MDAHVKSVVGYLWEHPPRCAAGHCAPAPAEVVSTIQRSHPGVVTVFEIRDSTLRVFPLWATRLQRGNQLSWQDPLLVGSEIRERAVFVFDGRTDGYDGEFGFRADEKVAGQDAVSCPHCQGYEFRLFVGFEYPLNDEDLDDPDLGQRREDFFTWLVLLGECAVCATRSILADIECA